MRNQQIILSKYIRISLILIIVTFSISCRENVLSNSANGLVVILKADDLGDTTRNWNRFIKILNDDSICAGIGVITKNVHKSTVSEIQKISNINQSNGFPVVEFWNHGYDHINLKEKDAVTEFYNTDFKYQQKHFSIAQHFFSDTLHLTSHSFGAPHNRTTYLTETVIQSFPEINVWQHYSKIENYKLTGWKDPKFTIIHETDKHIILSIDYLSLMKINLEDFFNNYAKDNMKPYLLIQIHPANWDEATFEKFETLVAFYKLKHATFMTPYQYYQFLHKKQN